MSSWQISWRNLTRRKLRTLFTSLAIILGVATSLSVMVSIDSTKQAIASMVRDFNEKSDLKVKGVSYTYSEEVFQKVKGLDNPLAVLDYPARLDGSQMRTITNMVTDPSAMKVMLHGYSTLQHPLLAYEVEHGSLPQQGMVVNESTARLWHVRIGDSVTLLVNGQPCTTMVTAIVKDQVELSSPTSWEDAPFQTWHVALPLATLQKWSGLNGQISEIDLGVPTEEKSAVKAKLDHFLQSDRTVYVEQVSKDQSDIARGIEEIYQGLYMLGALGLLISGIIFFGTIYVSVTERKKEIAIMKTLGYTRGQVSRLIMQEVLLLSSISTVIGIGLGISLSKGLTSQLFKIFDLHTDIQLNVWIPTVISASLGILISFVAAMLPVLQASRVSISYTLKEESTEQPSQRRWWLPVLGMLLISVGLLMTNAGRVIPLLLGLILIFPALMLIIHRVIAPIVSGCFGYEGVVAGRNVARKRYQSAVPSAILGMSISFIVLVNAIGISYQTSILDSTRYFLGGDVALTLSTPILPDDLKQIRQIQNVENVVTFKEVNALWQGKAQQRNILMVGTPVEDNPFPLFTATNGSVNQVLNQLKEPGTIALGNSMFQQWGGKVGDRIRIQTPTGEQSFTVVAVVNTLQAKGNVGFVSAKQVSNSFGVSYAKQMTITTKSGTNLATFKNQLVDRFQERLSSIQTVDEYLSHRLKATQQPLTLINLLLVVIMVVSGIGILNTLLIHVMERTREIGMMRAVAYTKRQVVKMIVGEGLFIGTSGILIGIPLGLLLVYSMAQTDQTIAPSLVFIIPWTAIGGATAFGVIVSLISSIVPAAEATKIQLSEALQDE